MASKINSPTVITDFFPPSPKQEESKTGEDTVTDKSIVLTSTEKDENSESPLSNLSHSSVVITPQSTPEKDGTLSKETEKEDKNIKNSPEGAENKKIEEQKPDSQSEESKPEEERSLRKPACKKALSAELQTDISTDLPPKSKRRGRRKKAGQAKTDSPIPESSESSKPPSKPKSSRKKTPELKNHLLTDFFAVRRSDRRSKTDIETEKVKDLHYKILNGVEDGLLVEDIPNKGRGVVATKAFKRGDFVVEYSGDLIDMNEAKQRDTKYSKDPTKGCYMYYFNFKNKKYCIDATEESGKLGRLLNHSKSAGNCHTKLVDVNNSPYLILVASRDISAGEELQYDYGDRSKASVESHPWLKC